MLLNQHNSSVNDEFFQTVVIHSLVNVLHDSTYKDHYQAVEAIMMIFRTQRLRCVNFLPQVCESMIQRRALLTVNRLSLHSSMSFALHIPLVPSFTSNNLRSLLQSLSCISATTSMMSLISSTSFGTPTLPFRSPSSPSLRPLRRPWKENSRHTCPSFCSKF